MKQEFDFNISVSLTIDLDANSSHSPQQVSQDIMEEVSSELHMFQELSKLLAYGGLVLLVCSFLRSGRTPHFNLIICLCLFSATRRTQESITSKTEGRSL